MIRSATLPTVRITGQRRPDRGTIGGSSADRDYGMSKYDNARLTSPISKGCGAALRLCSSNRKVLSELKGVACGSFRIEIVGSETPLQSRLEEDVFAEVAATNMAIVKAMGLLASVATDRRPHLSRILEAGLLDFEQIDYPNIPKRRRAGFRRKVKARYASLLRAIP